jgi:integration host factor subunit beta
MMATITKKQLVDRITQSTQSKNSLVQSIIQQFLDNIVSELSEGNRIEFRDFGVFETRIRAARKAHNPKTFEFVQVPAKRTVRFKMGRLMKQKLNGQSQ